MEFPTMAQMNKIKGAIAMAGLVGGLALAGVPAFAQTPTPSTPQAAPGNGMMMMKDMPNGQAGMPMNPEMMQKMSKMMDNCNNMMESMKKKDGTDAPSAPANKG